MKIKIAFLLQITLVILLSACGGGGEVVAATSDQMEAAATMAPMSEQVEIEATVEWAPPPAPISEYPGYTEPNNPSYQYNEEIPGYIDAERDHLSTFGIDVDTASYTIARDYIKDGHLPSADMIRVEEFINFFDAGYPTPDDIAFGLYADGAPTPFHSPGTYLLRFGIQGYEVPEEMRKPVSLTFVIDVSGSMSEPNKLELVKRSLNLLVKRLRYNDTVCIVTYGSEAYLTLKPTSGSNQAKILNAINGLRSGGTTYAEMGLRLGYQMAIENFDPNVINRVILASDGVANVGRTDPDDLLSFIRGYANAGITLTTMGFGMGTFNDSFMEELADKGDGSYAYIDNIDEAERLFVDELTSTLQVIARDAKIQVDFNPEVVSYYRLLGYENRAIADEEFRDDTVDAGEIGAGHSVTALYAVKLIPGSSGRIATMQMRWEDPETREMIEINGNFNTWSLEETFSEADPHFQLAVIAAQFAEILMRSPYSSETTLDDLIEYANSLLYSMPDDTQVREFVEVLYQANSLRK